MRSRSICLISTLSVLVVNDVARAQCDKWQRLGTGMDDAVLSLTVYNDELIAGGMFSKLGCKPVHSIARWDGLEWHPLSGGSIQNSPYIPFVYALAVYNGELIAGGVFTTAGGQPVNGIARWNGSVWQPLGSGMSGEHPYVVKLMLYQGDLIAGGSFAGAGESSAHCIARWNGSIWEPLGTGMDGSLGPGVSSLTVYNGDLIAGGVFETAGGQSADNIARWDGTEWHSFAGGMNNSVDALAVYKGELIAGGRFTVAGGENVNRIGRWNGLTWQALGSGMQAGREEDPPHVASLLEYGGDLIAGGYFSVAGGQSAKSIARWDGTAWHPLAGGLADSLFGQFGAALETFNGELIVGGDFDVAGAMQVNNVATWHCDPCLADVTDDELVDVNDLNVIINSWGLCPPQSPLCPGDIGPQGGDGTVDSNDLDVVLLYMQYGVTCQYHEACQCPPDVNVDLAINAGDILAILEHWGPCPLPAPPPCPIDIVQDGKIDAKELLTVINSWGPCP